MIYLAGLFQSPDKVCDDPTCPFHGSIRVRGRILKGVVISDKMQRTVTVRVDYVKYDQKYKRYEKRFSKIKAHNPPCINAKVGDIVYIGETRPISKTVHFVVCQIERQKS
ncbi:MAG: 30S ribosomal protein S17 [Crenarchaeota archaeon]|nr:30S ribosomal protein S17 [Thermoproteota archaeon]MCR8453409.1 30S ribosomal protein S17 [Thermoproteota archaeon]MCR8454947.1 30S ribosomal protein S17 [Thermoproteota archaeon]MCR8463141.1 30S ribosomal protein S17 [Thermoproteota archaeon]MCR8471016.1 30S ribosomal protein S17 [Thermoproteota archaeon]